MHKTSNEHLIETFQEIQIQQFKANLRLFWLLFSF